MAQQHDSVLYTLINLHAPLVSKKISLKPPNPWMTPAILSSKRHRRYVERVWRRNPTALNRSRLTRQTHLCNRQILKAKSTHYSKIIAEHSGNYGSLWKAFKKSYTVALKCTFVIILLLLLWQTHSGRFSLIKSLLFALPSPLTHTHVCQTPLIPGRFFRISLVSLPSCPTGSMQVF